MTTEKIRVLHVIPTLKLEGAQTFIMNVFRNIDKNKFEFVFLISKSHEDSYEDEIRRLGGKIEYIIPRNKINLINYSTLLADQMEQLGGFDAIHSHIMHYNGVILKAAYKAQIPTRICHSHNTHDGYKDSIQRKIYRNAMSKLINKYSTNLFACSPEAAKYLYPKYVTDKRIQVINNGIELDKYNPLRFDKEKILNELGLDMNTKLIGHVGRFHPQKNHKKIIDIFSEYLKINPDTKLLLVGEGDEREAIESYVSLNNISENVLFLGNRSDIPELMNLFDVFLFPSLYEGLGIVLVEAQAAGLKCVVSSNIPELVDMNLSLITRVSLDEDASYWALKIDENMKYQKPSWKKIKQEIEKNDFDVSQIISNISKIYKGNVYKNE